ncbi:hypothetical protein [Herbidospora sp. RD11066]
MNTMKSGVTAALCLGLLAPAQLAHAEAPGSRPVAVINGDFALPAFKAGSVNVTTPTGWSVGSTNGAGTYNGVGRVAPADNGHPDGKTAVLLRQPLPANAFKQRLRGVRAGAKVTVTFDDSPSVAAVCTPAALADGQGYTVEATGGAVSDRTTAPDPDKKVRVAGQGVWRTGQTYSFTASEHEPLLTFTSKVPATENVGGNCGPMIADVRAVQTPPPLDKTIPKTALPSSVAFRGNDSRSVADAVSHCNGDLGRCVFLPERDYSFAYYEPAEVTGDTYINCTRNALNRTRPVAAGGQSFGDLPAAAKLPGTGDRPSNMAQQFTAGTGTSPAWTVTGTRQVTEVVQPSEVSWIETQAGRRRTEGWFVSSPTPAEPHDEWRLYTVLDHPATELSDRMYQRTGPMTASEKQRCRSDRPTTSTPVGAASPAGTNRG